MSRQRAASDEYRQIGAAENMHSDNRFKGDARSLKLRADDRETDDSEPAAAIADPCPSKTLAYLDSLPFPRYCLRIQAAQWNAGEPMPFQWSCHIEHGSGERNHATFLDLSGRDVRRQFATSLIQLMRPPGPVFVYSTDFDRQCLHDIASRCPDLAPALAEIELHLIGLQALIAGRPTMDWVTRAMPGNGRITRPMLDDPRARISAYRRALNPRSPAAGRHHAALAMRHDRQRETRAMQQMVQVLSSRGSWRYLRPDLAWHGSTGGPAMLGDTPVELVDEALALMRIHLENGGSTLMWRPLSWMQRSLKLGYGATIRLMDTLDRIGAVTRFAQKCLAAG